MRAALRKLLGCARFDLADRLDGPAERLAPYKLLRPSSWRTGRRLPRQQDSVAARPFSFMLVYRL